MTKSTSSSIEKEIGFGNLLFFTCMIELIFSLFFWGEIIELRYETICCILGLLLGTPDQHANWKKIEI